MFGESMSTARAVPPCCLPDMAFAVWSATATCNPVPRELGDYRQGFAAWS